MTVFEHSFVGSKSQNSPQKAVSYRLLERFLSVLKMFQKYPPPPPRPPPRKYPPLTHAEVWPVSGVSNI